MIKIRKIGENKPCNMEIRTADEEGSFFADYKGETRVSRLKKNKKDIMGVCVGEKEREREREREDIGSYVVHLFTFFVELLLLVEDGDFLGVHATGLALPVSFFTFPTALSDEGVFGLLPEVGVCHEMQHE